jgi:hypothetical protein
LLQWTEANLPLLGPLAERTLALLPKAQAPAQAADVIRLAALYGSGGLYLDADCKVTHALDDLFLRLDNSIYLTWDVDGLALNNCIMAGQAGDPFWIRCFEECERRMNRAQRGHIPAESGPQVVTEIARLPEFKERLVVLGLPFVARLNLNPLAARWSWISHDLTRSWDGPPSPGRIR